MFIATVEYYMSVCLSVWGKLCFRVLQAIKLDLH